MNTEVRSLQDLLAAGQKAEWGDGVNVVDSFIEYIEVNTDKKEFRLAYYFATNWDTLQEINIRTDGKQGGSFGVVGYGYECLIPDFLYCLIVNWLEGYGITEDVGSINCSRGDYLGIYEYEGLSGVIHWDDFSEIERNVSLDWHDLDYDFFIPQVYDEIKYDEATDLFICIKTGENGRREETHINRFEEICKRTYTPGSSTKHLDITIGEAIGFGAEAWYVLDVQNGKALLLNVFAIDKKAFHNNLNGTTWKKSDMRKYLNDELFSTFRFNQSDINRISKTVIHTPENNGSYGSKLTADKLFLLSVDEVNRYFGDNVLDAFMNNMPDVKHSGWWLRSHGNGFSRTAYVSDDGQVDLHGRSSDVPGGVRPALWLDLGTGGNVKHA